MVKRARALVELEGEAGVAYEQTALAKRAIPARRRIAWLLVVGAALLALEAALQQSAWWLVGSAILALTGMAVRGGRLGGIVTAAFIGVLAIALPLRTILIQGADTSLIVMAFVSVVWGAALLPDLITLFRDAELQYTYGLWARRSE